MKKRLLRVLEGQRLSPPPLWFMRQAGRYLPEYLRLRKLQPDFLRFCYTPELAIEATLQPLHRFQPDAAILFSDILVIADALGRSVRFVEGHGPVLEPVRTPADIAGLTAPEEAVGRLAPVFATVSGIAAALPAEVALIGFAGAPWTMALYMLEGRGGTAGGRARAFACGQPEACGRLIDALVEVTVSYLSRQIEAGAEVVQLFDSWAGLLSVEEFRRWVIAPTVAIVDALGRRHPDVPVIGFPRGAGILYREFAERTGVAAVGIDAAVPVEWARAELQPRHTVQGNLDNVLLATGGAEMERSTRHILETLDGGPFIFNLGHGVLPETPPENLARVVDLIRASGQQGSG